MSYVTMTTRSAERRAVALALTSHWFEIFAAVFGVWVLLPWIAPLLMHAGLSLPGRIIYGVYSLFCHQLPERSFFLFGPQTMYPLSEIQAAWQNTLSPMVLRGFVGNEAMGWKVAWSDRMVSLYTSIWLAAFVWWPLRRKLKPLPWWAFGLLILPLILDGVTHAISDFSGLGRGFRDTNLWLVNLTGAVWPRAYAGDMLGSFNSWARLITGILGGLGIAWFVFPHLEAPVAPQ
jgi:uncharacterized membrane protein